MEKTKRKQRIAVLLLPEFGRMSDTRGWTNRRKCYEDLHAEGFDIGVPNLWRWYAKLADRQKYVVTAADGRKWRVMVVPLR